MFSEHLFTTRREFVTRSLKLLSAATTLPVFLSHTASALADPTPRQRRKDDASCILVVVQLSGGNDGLNTVIPYTQDAYYRYRPRLAIKKNDVLKLAKEVGLHPAADGLKALYDAGHLAVVQGVGYPNPNRSHFVSMDIWHTADPGQRTHDGWLGRYVDACCEGADPDPLEAIAIAQEAPLALQGERFTPLAFDDPGSLTWHGPRRDAKAEALFAKLNHKDGQVPDSPHAQQKYLQRAALDALLGADEIKSAAGGAIRTRSRGRGGALTQQLQMVARMIKADLPTRVYYVSLGGFDTHTGQEQRQRQLLETYGDALQDFIGALADDGLLDRVVVLSFSEFGRRVQENSSGGTDHGAAGPVFLFGSQIRPGVIKNHPSLDKLDRGDLAHGCDFRTIYAALLRDWLRLSPRDAARVLGREFNPLKVIKT